MRTFSVVADCLTGAAIVAGGVAIYFTLTSGKSKEKTPPPGTTSVGIGPGALQLKATF